MLFYVEAKHTTNQGDAHLITAFQPYHDAHTNTMKKREFKLCVNYQYHYLSNFIKTVIQSGADQIYSISQIQNMGTNGEFFFVPTNKTILMKIDYPFPKDDLDVLQFKYCDEKMDH